MAIFAFVKFQINYDFFEWEKHFYASQPMARKAGMLELFHGMQSDDPSSCAVLVSIESQEKMDEFMKDAGDAIAESGHILESTEVTFYEN